jgi:hypothetical protein
MEKRQLLVREEAADDLDGVEGLVGPVDSNHGAHSSLLRGKACQPSLPIELNDQASLGRRPHVEESTYLSSVRATNCSTCSTPSRTGKDKPAG